MEGLLNFEFFTFKRETTQPKEQVNVDLSAMDLSFKERYGFRYMS